MCLLFIDFMILWLHGENGTGPAKFNIPHSVTVDSTGRVNTWSDLCLDCLIIWSGACINIYGSWCTYACLHTWMCVYVSECVYLRVSGQFLQDWVYPHTLLHTSAALVTCH